MKCASDVAGVWVVVGASKVLSEWAIDALATNSVLSEVTWCANLVLIKRGGAQ